MLFMPATVATQLIRSVVDRLARLRPSQDVAAAPQPWQEPDSSWYLSSIDLAEGLEVIEHHESASHFADTMPAFHAPAKGRR